MYSCQHFHSSDRIRHALAISCDAVVYAKSVQNGDVGGSTKHRSRIHAYQANVWSSLLNETRHHAFSFPLWAAITSLFAVWSYGVPFRSPYTSIAPKPQSRRSAVSSAAE